MIAILAVLIMLVGRLTYLAELNINPILDDRRITTSVLYERMKHITGCLSAICGRLHWVFSIPQGNKKMLTDYAVKMGQQAS